MTDLATKSGPAYRVPLGRRISELRRLIFRVRTRFYFTFDQTLAYTRSIGVQAGDGAVIYPSVQFGSEPWLVTIGAGTWLTAGVQFVTHDHAVVVGRSPVHAVPVDEPLNRFERVRVGRHSFVGVSALLLPGVTVGDDCIVGAASVVTRDVPSGSVVAGNPARIVGTTADYVAHVRANALPIPAAFVSQAKKRAAIIEALDARDEEPGERS